MGRKPRQKSAAGIYHIMLRGADHRIIFGDEEDCNRLNRILLLMKRITQWSIITFIIMEYRIFCSSA